MALLTNGNATPQRIQEITTLLADWRLAHPDITSDHAYTYDELVQARAIP